MEKLTHTCPNCELPCLKTGEDEFYVFYLCEVCGYTHEEEKGCET